MGAVIFSGIIVFLLEVVIAAAVGVCLWSLVCSLRKREQWQTVSNGIPASLISRSIAIGLVTLLLLTYILGSSKPIFINGMPYDSVTWLKLSDMFVMSLYVMLAVAAIAVVAGRVWSRRLRSGTKKGVSHEDKKS